jgi:hypothetical protein
MLADKLQALLGRTKGEREVTAFLKEHPSVVLDALVRFGDGNCVVADFPFGTEFKADFVALAPFSGGWEIHFVELEPPNARLFNRKRALLLILYRCFGFGTPARERDKPKAG